VGGSLVAPPGRVIGPQRPRHLRGKLKHLKSLQKAIPPKAAPSCILEWCWYHDTSL
jgi:hypothetical protein